MQGALQPRALYSAKKAKRYETRKQKKQLKYSGKVIRVRSFVNLEMQVNI